MSQKDHNLSALYDAIHSCTSTDELARFMRDLCTRQELEAFAERWWIARLLAEGNASYREISQLTGASTTTIGRVVRFLQQEPHEGYKLVLDRLADKTK